jgi:hypothetical protein
MGIEEEIAVVLQGLVDAQGVCELLAQYFKYAELEAEGRDVKLVIRNAGLSSLLRCTAQRLAELERRLASLN